MIYATDKLLDLDDHLYTCTTCVRTEWRAERDCNGKARCAARSPLDPCIGFHRHSLSDGTLPLPELYLHSPRLCSGLIYARCAYCRRPYRL